MPIENNPNDKLSELRWEIKPEEQRERSKKEFYLLLKSLPLLALIFFSGLIGSGDFSLFESLKGLFVVMFLITVFLCIYYKFIKRAVDRKYVLNEQGLIITKGNKTQLYLWQEFECFYKYSALRYDSDNIKFKGNRYMSKQERGKIIEIEHAIEKTNGDKFYLKKKTDSVFYGASALTPKKFVVIYSEPDNSKTVEEFLNKVLPKKEMTATTDLGLVFYEFK